jgi:hypothetical protein
MKRKLFACFLALTMLTVLTACGGKAANSSASASADTSEAMVPDYTENDSYASYTGSDSGSGGFDETESLPTDAAEQKIIYTGDLNLEATDFDAATRSLSALAEELGGYVENSSIGSSSRGYRWADYTIRIPSGQFQRFFEQAGELAHETWRSTNQENITEVYYDTAGRLKTQQVKLERLQTLLAQAKNMEDIITIESAISETEWNIENLSGTLRRYDSQVALSTITVNLQEVYKYSNTENVPESFGERIGSALTRGWSAFTDTVENILVALAYGWTWLVLLAASPPLSAPAAHCAAGRKSGRPRRKKRMTKPVRSDTVRAAALRRPFLMF